MDLNINISELVVQDSELSSITESGSGRSSRSSSLQSNEEGKNEPLKRLKQVGRSGTIEKIDISRKWITCVFGECGQGKSTVLGEIVKLHETHYHKGLVHGCNFYGK